MNRHFRRLSSRLKRRTAVLAVLAGSIAAGAAQPVAFHIPSEPLAHALADFEREGHVRVKADPAIVRGKQSPGFTGTATPANALGALLAGTGLSTSIAGDEIAIVPGGDLKTIVVVGSNGAPYQPHASANGRYAGRALVDVPQSITVVTQQVMRDRGNTTLRDALRNVSGISLQAGEGGSQGDSLTIRGFDARDDFYLDGMRDYGNYYRDPFNTESVEVDEGASGSLSGRGGTGGVINQISKTPFLGSLHAFSAGLGSDETQRLTSDTNLALSATSAIRVNTMADHNDVAGRNVTQSNRWGIAPTWATGLGTDERFSLSYFHQSEHNIPDYGFPIVEGEPAAVPRSDFFGFKDQDHDDENADVFTAKLERDLNGSQTFNLQTRFADYQHDFFSSVGKLTTNPPAGTPLQDITIGRTTHARAGSNVYGDAIADITGHTDTSTSDLGIEFSAEGDREHSPTYTGLPSTNLWDPNYDQPFTYTSVAWQYTQASASTMGAFAVDTVDVGSHLEATGSVRYDLFDARSQNLTTPSFVQQTVGMISDRAALTYKPRKNRSIYLAYSTSFDPVLEALSVRGAATPPEKTIEEEMGGKADLDGGALSLTGALFREVQLNTRETDPVSGVVENLASERVNGVSLQATGRAGNSVDLIAGYTLLDSLVIASQNPLELGNPMGNTPRNTFTLWADDKFNRHWSAGVGAIGVSAREATAVTSSTYGVLPTAPGYWRLDAMLRSELSQHLALQLNVYNLTNAFYYDLMYSDHVVPGASRSAVLRLDVK